MPPKPSSLPFHGACMKKSCTRYARYLAAWYSPTRLEATLVTWYCAKHASAAQVDGAVLTPDPELAVYERPRPGV